MQTDHSDASRPDERGGSTGDSPQSKSPIPGHSATEQTIRRIEWALGILITLAALWLSWVYVSHAGGLWRDEAGAVRLATLPTFSETWRELGHESFPLIFPAAIRAWSALGLGNTDFALRVYGFIVGVLILGALWLNSRVMTRSIPLISLGLLAANLAVVRWGGSLRGYGTGSVFMLLAIAGVWQFARSPSRTRWLVAALAALLSVHCLFQNAFLLLAACLAGFAVRLRQRDPKGAAAAIGIGVPAALSLLVYLRIIRESLDWSALVEGDFTTDRLWRNLSSALGYALPWTKWVWIGLVLLVVVRWLGSFRRGTSARASEPASAAFFAGTALITGMAAFYCYLRIASFPTEVWYYLPLMTFAAVCIDAALEDWLPRQRWWRLPLLCVMVGLPFPTALKYADYRQTDVDVIAAALREKAGPNDLIVVYPWNLGITFDRYYRGQTPWVTIPDIDDHRFHRYDLVKVKMQMEHPLQPVLDRVASTLQSGNCVWVVGSIPEYRVSVPDLRPAPNGPRGWFEPPYDAAWGAQVTDFLMTHASQGSMVMDPSTNHVDNYENVPLIMVSGGHPPSK